MDPFLPSSITLYRLGVAHRVAEVLFQLHWWKSELGTILWRNRDSSDFTFINIGCFMFYSMYKVRRCFSILRDPGLFSRLTWVQKVQFTLILASLKWGPASSLRSKMISCMCLVLKVFSCWKIHSDKYTVLKMTQKVSFWEYVNFRVPKINIRCG